LRRIVVLVIVTILLLFVSAATALGQVSSQASCNWYWDYTFNPNGGWEYWCWDPQQGQWYGTDGTNKIVSATFSD
jgi:hypothetical protein